MALSADQLDALWDSGKPIRGLITVSARPGTGKTTTLSEYCIDIADRWSHHHRSWQGMSVLSYTNVAKDELEHKIRNAGRASTLLRTPHFLGTLDAFINQHLFLPHGARIMQYPGGRPQLVGEPHYPWTNPDRLCADKPTKASATIFFDCYSVGADGIPYVIDSNPRWVNAYRQNPVAPVTPANSGRILAMKRHIWKNGAAVQADANYIALEALRTSPALTNAFAGRFPILVIDEAQDMTEVQHAIIGHLIAAGHNHIVLVGDENQAIYEWNTARPQLFIDKRTPQPDATTRWDPRTLGSSYRCSPAICSALTAMSSHQSPLTPADDAKNAAYPLPVDITTYEQPIQAANAIAAIEALAAKLTGTAAHTRHDNNVKTIAVITRGSTGLNLIQAAYTGIAGATSAPRVHWGDHLTRSYLKVIHQLRQHGFAAAMPAYEALLIKAGDHSSAASMRSELMARLRRNPADVVAYRATLFADLDRISIAMPTDEQATISDCAGACAINLTGMPSAQMTRMQNDCRNFLDDARAGQNRRLLNLFTAADDRVWHTAAGHEDIRLTFSTAHGVKGETYDGVIFFIGEKTSGCGCPGGRSTSMWSAILSHPLAECETKRIAYVALSRAAQALTILTPASTLSAWTGHLRPSRLSAQAATVYHQEMLFADAH